ncbi:MAG: DNA primase [Bryobacterales bacterium]|nr:DNA primase [Bryobacterales bacterium]
MDFAAHVKSSVDIVGVVGESVRLRKQGPNRFVGLCPFHTEKTPSFSVHQGLQIFKCFGCGKGGDVFNFLMETQGLTFYEALRSLAESHGIPMPASSGGLRSDTESRLREALDQMHEKAQSWFRQQIHSPAGSDAREYIEGRGLSASMQELFGLGYAPAAGGFLVAGFKREGRSEREMEASGLVAKRAESAGFYDRFRDRLTFPIHNERGKIIAFAGRALRQDQAPKYMNSPETAIYKKHNVLYNLHRAREAIRRERMAVLVEGYMDVIGACQSGVEYVIASCGTALTLNHARALRRHADAVIVNFDPDAAGQGAVEKSIDLLIQEGLSVRVLQLPDGLDPYDYCRKHGGEAYRGKLDEAPGYHDWLADQARSRFDTRTAEGRSAAIRFVDPKIRLLSEPIQRALVAEQVGHRMGLDRLVLSQFVQSFGRTRNQAKAIVNETRLSEGERILLRLVIGSSEARRELLGDALELAAKQDLPSCKIFEAAQAASEQDEAFPYSALQGRLEQQERQLLDLTVLAAEGPEPSIESGRRAVEALRREAHKREHRAILRDIAIADQAGDTEKLFELLRRKKELNAPIVNQERTATAPQPGSSGS